MDTSGMIYRGTAAAAMVDRDGQLVRHSIDWRKAYPVRVSHVAAWAAGACALAKQATGDIATVILLARSDLGRTVKRMVDAGYLGDLSLGGQGYVSGSIVPAGVNAAQRKTHAPVEMVVAELTIGPCGGARNPGAFIKGVRRKESPDGSLVLALRSAYLAGIDINPFLALLPPDKANKLRRLVTSPPAPGGEDPLSPTGTNPVSSFGTPYPHAALYQVRPEDAVPALAAPVSLGAVRAAVTKHVRAVVRREELTKEMLLGL